MSTGTLSVLNVGAGDIQVSFNQHDAEERQRAVRMLKDMQARGYAILVRLDDGTYTRALEIDEAHGAYVIQTPEPAAAAPVAEPPRRGRRRGRTKVPFEQAKAIGVARSAGG
ncbi:MAG: hypothetical protein AB7O67_23280 [Vicinamibacterales bacterium]